VGGKVEKEKAKLFPTERPHKDVWAGLANEAGSMCCKDGKGLLYKDS